jgi:hypothetical protein
VLGCDFDDYKKHSGNSQGTVRDQSGISQGTLRDQSGNIQYNECLVATLLTAGNTQGTFREQSVTDAPLLPIWEEEAAAAVVGFREQSGNIQGTFRDHSGIIQ